MKFNFNKKRKNLGIFNLSTSKLTKKNIVSINKIMENNCKLYNKYWLNYYLYNGFNIILKKYSIFMEIYKLQDKYKNIILKKISYKVSFKIKIIYIT